MALSAEERAQRREERKAAQEQRREDRQEAQQQRREERAAAREERREERESRRAERRGETTPEAAPAPGVLSTMSSPTGPFSMADVLNPEWYQGGKNIKPQVRDWQNLLNNYIMAKGHYGNLMLNPMADPSWLNLRDQIDLSAQSAGKTLEQGLLRRGMTGGSVASGLTNVENQRLATLGSTLSAIRSNAEKQFYGMQPPVMKDVYYNRTNTQQQEQGTDWGSLAMAGGMLLGSNAGSSLLVS